MILLLEEYHDIIRKYDIQRFREYGTAYEFIAIAEFRDGTVLHIRDYLFLDGTKKYSFHWQSADGNLIIRWDNAEHHRYISTFPFHQHTPKGIEASQPMTLKKVLEFIRSRIER